MTADAVSQQRGAARFIAMRFVIAAALAVAATSDTCTVADGPVTCETCPSGSDGNVVATLPRYNAAGRKVSSNLGDYAFVRCYGDAGGPSSPNASCNGPAGFSASGITGSAATTDIATYLQGVLGYAVFAVICALVSLVFACSYCFGRVCCCCIKGGCCGKVYPTYAMSSFRLGFTVVDAPLLSDHGGRHELAYPLHARWMTRVCMFTYVLLVLVFIGVGNARGNQGITTSMQTMATSTSGFMNTIRGLQAPVSNLMVDVASDGIAPLLLGLNSTIQSAVSINALVLNSRCVINGVATSLPDPAILLAFVASINGTLLAVTRGGNDLQGNMSQIVATLNTMPAQASVLRTNVTTLYSTISTLNVTVLAATASMNAMQTYMAAFQSPTTGVPSASADLTATTTNMPTQASVTAAASGTDSLTSLRAGSMDGNGAAATSRANLQTSLTTLQTKTTALPDFAALSTKLSNLNTQITNLRASGLIPALLGNLTTINASINAIPSVTALNSTINNLRGILNSIDLTGIRATMVSFNVTLATLPSFAIVTTELNKIYGVTPLLQCMSNLITLASGLNATVVQLPSTFNTVSDLVTSANNTLQPALGQVGTFNSQLSNLSSQVASINMSSYIALVDSTTAQIRNPPVDFSSIWTSMASAQTQRNTLNVQNMIAGITSLNASIYDTNVITPSSTLTNLNNLAPVVTTLKTQISASLVDLVLFSTTLRCGASGVVCTTAGSTAAPCSNLNPCTAGQRICVVSGTACTQDSDCTGGADTCAYHDAIHATTITAMTAYVGAGPDAFVSSLAPLATSVAAASAAVAGVPPLTGLSSNVTSLQTALAVIPINSTLSSIDTLNAQVSPGALNLGGINASINSALGVTTTVDLSSIRSQLLSFNSSIGSIKDQTSSTLNVVDRLVTSVQTFFASTLPAVTTRLSRPSLAAIQAARGLTGVARELAAIAQVVIAFVNDATNTSSSGTSSPTFTFNASSTVDSVLQFTNVITDPVYANNGPLYFFTQLASASSNASASATYVSVDSYNAAGGGDIWYSASGARWSGDRYCLLQSCVSASINKLNKDPFVLRSAMTGGGGSDRVLVSANISRESVMFLPYLFPLLICLVGLVGAVGLRGKQWQRWPTCISTCCICTVLPFIFLAAGALSFPLIMFISDGCRGGLNIAYKYIAGSEASICNSFSNSVYIPSSSGINICRISVQNQTVDVQIARTFQALLGDSGCQSYPTVISSLFTNARSAAVGAPSSFINSTLTSLTTGAPIVPRPVVQDLVRTFGLSLGASLGNLIDGVSNVLTCDQINRNIKQVTSGVCCDFVTALYWFVSSWYLIAFFMCCCGFGASVLGYKRYPNELWGPDYEARMATTLQAADKPGPDMSMMGDRDADFVPASAPDAGASTAASGAHHAQQHSEISDVATNPALISGVDDMVSRRMDEGPAAGTAGNHTATVVPFSPPPPTQGGDGIEMTALPPMAGYGYVQMAPMSTSATPGPGQHGDMVDANGRRVSMPMYLQTGVPMPMTMMPFMSPTAGGMAAMSPHAMGMQPMNADGSHARTSSVGMPPPYLGMMPMMPMMHTDGVGHLPGHAHSESSPAAGSGAARLPPLQHTPSVPTIPS